MAHFTTLADVQAILVRALTQHGNLETHHVDGTIELTFIPGTSEPGPYTFRLTLEEADER